MVDRGWRFHWFEVRFQGATPVPALEFSRPGAEEPIWARNGYRFRETYEIDVSAADYFDRSDQAIEEVAEKFAEVIVIDLLEGF